MDAQSLIGGAVAVLEAAGAAAMLIGMALSSLHYLRSGWRDGWAAAYRPLRANLGRSILLGLELLVAADILKTLRVTPELEDLGVLAGLVAIRTFLSIALGVEINGHWPWEEARLRQQLPDRTEARRL